MAQKKVRLDKLLVEQGLVETRAKAQGFILAGDVLVDGQRVDKPGTAIAATATLELKASLPYVSRGGFKLAAALTQFGIQPHGRVAADVGACTGGFTDVLLQNGAAYVYAIDVGYGQLNWNLRQHAQVEVMERTNARYLESLPQPISLVSIDVSFISLRLILPAVQKWITPEADVVALVKPQFEAGPDQVGKGGIIKDTAVHRAVLNQIVQWSQQHGFAPQGVIRSPVTGADGNTEFLLWLKAGTDSPLTSAAIEAVLAAPTTDHPH